MREHFKLPDVGEGLTEAEIVTWRVAPGDTVAVNDVIVEIETAKAAVELPSPWAGTVGELLVEPGATVAVGTPIIAIDTAGSAPDADAGAKIGEAGKDGRIATLVGYGPRQGSARRRPRRDPAAADPAAADPAASASAPAASASAAAPAGSVMPAASAEPPPEAPGAVLHRGRPRRPSRPLPRPPPVFRTVPPRAPRATVWGRGPRRSPSPHRRSACSRGSWASTCGP